MTRGLVALALAAGSGTAMASDIIFTDGFDDYTLSVNKTGTGFGTLTSTPAGIDCGSTCAAVYIQNTMVAVIATASTGSTFDVWGGACSSTGACVVTMNVAKPVSADFIFTGSDPFNCGAPGLVCRADQTCSASSCVCRPGLTATMVGPFPSCVDLQSDPNHCGSLSTVCAAGQECVSGSCSPFGTCRSQPARRDCAPPGGNNFACVKLASDPLNCGACANRCAVNEVCIAGNCNVFSY